MLSSSVGAGGDHRLQRAGGADEVGELEAKPFARNQADGGDDQAVLAKMEREILYQGQLAQAGPVTVVDQLLPDRKRHEQPHHASPVDGREAATDERDEHDRQQGDRQRRQVEAAENF